METTNLKFIFESAAALAGIVCIAFFAYVMLLSRKTK